MCVWSDCVCVECLCECGVIGHSRLITKMNNGYLTIAFGFLPLFGCRTISTFVDIDLRKSGN